MSTRAPPPRWQLPRGVTRAMWEYAQSPQIAEEYDEYFEYNTLFDFDAAVLRRCFTTRGRLVDLGCGTGRLLMPFAQAGFPCLAVDLSAHMLHLVGQKAAAANVPVDRLLANMVQLDCLADDCADYCISMFSTLGMIRGHENRLLALKHVRRILKPGGRFVLHVHNLWYSLLEPLGRRWLLRHFWQAWVRRSVELGDKFFDYRGVPNMFLHAFRQGELTGLLRRAGFRVEELIALDTARRHPLRWPWLLGRLRANGWIAVCS